ncbi:DUF4340 domain-containing protein [Simiduia aestuariiviva]|uniref:DUF4340 domain-containing protein n=1 Tax=Simiduia aestuariiviva TaxID=1510459 RepID=A0A839UJ09_9GAMM|nr:DUF4340 domain-containing protein [Simiduia aestuariiviva]MBB3167533.1 hypothetical protein [Simiduia aestuariiviva]
MKKLSQWLGGLLAVQLLAASGMLWMDTYQQTPLAAPLLATSPAAVDKIVITEGDQHTTLVKSSEQWRLPDLKSLPADQSKVGNLLAKLSEQKTTYPIATQSNSHERFELTEDNAQRRVQLFAGQASVGHYLLGTSPGLRQLHLRRANEDAVYTVNLNRFDFLGDQQQWLDRSLLAAKSPVEIAGADFTLKKEEQHWALVDAEDIEVDSGKVSALATALSNLRVQSVAEGVIFEPETSAKLQVVNTGQPEPLHYQLMQHDNKYYIKRSDFDTAFEVSEFDFKRLHAPELSTLVANHNKEDANTGDQS